MNGDGLQDIVYSGFSEPANTQGSAIIGIYVFYQNADGTLTDKTAQVISNNAIEGAMTIQVADIDGDGYQDIYVPSGQDNVLAHMIIFWGGATSFTRQDFPDYAMMSGCLGDFNGDGKSDLFVNSVQTGATNISTFYINNGNRTFTKNQITSIPTGGNGCAAIKVGSNYAIYILKIMEMVHLPTPYPLDYSQQTLGTLVKRSL